MFNSQKENILMVMMYLYLEMCSEVALILIVFRDVCVCFCPVFVPVRQRE